MPSLYDIPSLADMLVTPPPARTKGAFGLPLGTAPDLLPDLPLFKPLLGNGVQGGSRPISATTLSDYTGKGTAPRAAVAGGQIRPVIRPHQYVDSTGMTVVVGQRADGKASYKYFFPNHQQATQKEYAQALKNTAKAAASTPRTWGQKFDTDMTILTEGAKKFPSTVGNAIGDSIRAKAYYDAGRDLGVLEKHGLAKPGEQAAAWQQGWQAQQAADPQITALARGGINLFNVGDTIADAGQDALEGNRDLAKKRLVGVPAQAYNFWEDHPFLFTGDGLTAFGGIAGGAGRVASVAGRVAKVAGTGAKVAEAAGDTGRMARLGSVVKTAQGVQRGANTVQKVAHSVATVAPVTKPIGKAAKVIAGKITQPGALEAIGATFPGLVGMRDISTILGNSGVRAADSRSPRGNAFVDPLGIFPGLQLGPSLAFDGPMPNGGGVGRRPNPYRPTLFADQSSGPGNGIPKAGAPDQATASAAVTGQGAAVAGQPAAAAIVPTIEMNPAERYGKRAMGRQADPERPHSVSEYLTDKIALRKPGATQNQVNDVLIKYYTPSEYQELAGRKDNVYVVVPSTSGKNPIPRKFADQLAKDFGGEVVDDWGRPIATKESKQKLNFLDKADEPARYDLGDTDLSRFKGKNVIIVDDVFSTGDSVEGVRQALAQQGIKKTRVASLISTDPRFASPRDIDWFSDELARTLGKNRSEVRQTAQAAFKGMGKIYLARARKAVSGQTEAIYRARAQAVYNAMEKAAKNR